MLSVHCSVNLKLSLKGKPKLLENRASLVAQLVKNPPAVRETWVRPLGWEDLLEKGKATHSSILAGEFHGLCSPWDHKDPMCLSDRTEQLSLIRK